MSATLFSQRFQRPVMRTTHARKRMAERTISESLLLDIIDTGTLKPKDAQRIWIFKGYPDRGDNLLCIAALLHTALIVKTVMQHFQPE